jgi:hypothetical protein
VNLKPTLQADLSRVMAKAPVEQLTTLEKLIENNGNEKGAGHSSDELGISCYFIGFPSPYCTRSMEDLVPFRSQ